MSSVKETRFLVHHGSCESKCRFNESRNQKWNHDDCQCECKELDDWSSCKDDYMWNPSTCNCECNKTGKLN